MESRPRAPKTGTGASGSSLGRTLIGDLRSGQVRSSLREDVRELYRFYIAEEERERLARMGAIRRGFWIAWRLLRSLLLRLSPVRRLLLLASLLLLIEGFIRFRFGETQVILDFRLLGYVIVLLVLMLELKDKLLARDEIAVARQVQLALLPREHPRVEGWSIWSSSRPANDVGGDLVDYVEVPGSTGVALGDVAGKGLGAALLAAKLQASLRAVAADAPSLADLGHRLNATLHRDGIANRYATLFYASLRPGSGTVRFLNAGHNPAFLVRAGGLDRLGASAPPLGMFAEASYGEGAADLDVGDVLLVYSDGLTEATDARDEEFGERRLAAIAAACRALPAEEIGARVLSEVERFIGSRRPHDDLSLVIAVRQ